MRNKGKRWAGGAGNERGVALPVTLFALLVLSVMVSGALLTGATEAGISAAHQSATYDLYTAEGAIEAYVAEVNLALAPAQVEYRAPGAPGDPAVEAVQLAVSRIVQLASAADPAYPPDEIFALTATALSGGRTVTALARLTTESVRLRNRVAGAVTVGSRVEVRGNTTVSDGSDSPICTQAAADHALERAGNAVATWLGATAGNRVGSVAVRGAEPEKLTGDLLGATLGELVANAHLKLTRRETHNATITSDGSVADPLSPLLTPRNWGCPADMVACEPDSDRDWLPVIAIDASDPSKADGRGTVTLNLSHGQGMLIVYNGDLRLQGEFSFRGVILVDGGFSIHAAAGGAVDPKIEGALIGLGLGGSTSSIDHDLAAAPAIRYNRCAIELALDSFNSHGKPFRRKVDGSTFGWVEVIR